MFNISQFITDTYYVLTAPNNTDPCDEISITVSGYNGAGNGEMATISSLYFSAGDQYVLVCCGIYFIVIILCHIDQGSLPTLIKRWV